MIDDLPPLPEKEQIDKHLSTGIVIRGYTSAQMQAYASAAIEKDRERQGVPAGYVLVPIRPTQEILDVTDSEGWTWPELLAAAGSITEAEADDLAASPQPQPVQQEPCPECDGTGTVAGSQAHFPCPLCTSPQAAQPLSNADGLQISRALHHHGLTLVRTAQGFGVMKLGEITAYAATKGTT